MKLGAKELPAFLAAPHKTSLACVIYGADDGLVRSFAKQILTAVMGKNYDPINLTELTGGQLKEDPALLLDALNSYSLMGGQRLVWLRDVAENQAEEVASAVLKSQPPSYLLITAGELKKESKWRTLFEKDKKLGCLACYRDEGRQLQQVIQERFKELGIRAGSDVMQYLANHLGNDRGITLQEIEKIDIYLGKERNLTLDVVRDLTGDNRELTLEDVCNAVAGGKPELLPHLLTELYADGMQPIGLCRILTSHFQKIRQLQIAISEGTPLEQALMHQRIFFKQQVAMKEQLRKWSDTTLARALDALLETERQIKTSPVSPETLCSQMLQRLALSVAIKRSA
jgi:DNA polymerase-3 subunit delta